MPRGTGVVLALLLLSAAAAACGPDDEADDGRLSVVASFYPLAEAAEVVGGDLLAVDNLTPPGVEPHDLELAPDDLEALVTADVVLYIGGGFQPAVEDGAAESDARLVDAIHSIAVLPAPDGESSFDPHFWLDPGRYQDFVRVLAANLAAVDPEHADAYDANADAFAARLDALDEEFRDGLASCERRAMVVSHAAFGYLADAYRLEQVAISGVSPEAEPDPARLAELRTLVVEEGVTTIFTEELVSPEVAETLAEEAGVDVAVLNPLEGLTAEESEAGEDYESVMRTNLETLRSALGCA